MYFVCFIPLSQCLVLTYTCLFCVFYTPVTMFSIDCSTCLFCVYYTPVTMFSIDCSTCLFCVYYTPVLSLVYFVCIIPLSQGLVLTVPLVYFVSQGLALTVPLGYFVCPVTMFSIDCSTCLFWDVLYPCHNV